ncbi:autoinducer binding domain-containing protein [Blastopirellula marina]|uniref:autoinducer binding domain-containing protein n=1 Tax=Blastopirellula marina TaxID=124 RepID=UPI000E2ED8AC
MSASPRKRKNERTNANQRLGDERGYSICSHGANRQLGAFCVAGSRRRRSRHVRSSLLDERQRDRLADLAGRPAR